mgnify:CR=1 FL=1
MQLHLHCVRSKKHKNNLKLNDPIIHLKQEEAEMKEFLLPYGKEKLTAKIEDEHLAGVLLSELHSYKAPKSGAELVQDALEHPIGTPRLCDMAVGKKKVVVISSDHTRPVPSHIMMPLILAEIRKGNPDADITILISTGLHRTTTKEELAAKFGPEIMANEKIVVHEKEVKWSKHAPQTVEIYYNGIGYVGSGQQDVEEALEAPQTQDTAEPRQAS